MRQTLLTLLLDGAFHSGEDLARQLSISRAAIWKQIEVLREADFHIEAGGKRGYRLVPPSDAMHPAFWAGERLESVAYYASLDSTNHAAKALAISGAPAGALVVTDEQTAGRGRRGRGWVAPAGSSLLLSMVLRPELPPSRAQGITLAAALAMAESIEAVCGAEVGIKWPNDLVMGGRKICGMLLELQASEDAIDWVVLGAGVNVHQRAEDFPEELRETAGSIWTQTGKTISRSALCLHFWDAMAARAAQFAQTGWPGISEAYLARSVTVGRPVQVTGIMDSFSGVAEATDAEGTLWVRLDTGELRRVLAGDVSVRGVMGYV